MSTLTPRCIWQRRPLFRAVACGRTARSGTFRLEADLMSACPRVAYFCMEYGLDPAFAVYAGGLGILAGDHMKSAGDLHLPVTGIGLLWDEGYTRQVIGVGGAVEDQYPKTAREVLRRIDARGQVTEQG